MKTVRRTLASLLSLLMVLSCCTVLFPVFAGAEGISFGWGPTWLDVDENGVWQQNKTVPEAERFDYQYAAKYENGNYYFGLKYTGKLTGTADSYGNGSGTNLRLWVRNPATGYVSYNYFFDVSWNGTSFVTRLMRNTNAAGNKAAPVYGYDAESYPYTVNWAQTETGAEIELIVPDTVIGAGYETRAIFSVSNNDAKNYCLHSNNNDNAPASAWYAGDVVIIDEADFFEILGNTVSVDKNNSCYGDAQIPADESYGTVSYESDEENLYIRVRYHGDLSTNGTAYGNGNGAFVRIWFRDPDRMVDSQFKSYDYFLDVEYTPDGTRTRFLTNAKATKANEASVTYAYDADAKPYTVKGIVNEEAADGYKWEVRITMPISVISANGRWQFQPTLGFWGEHPDKSGNTVTGYSSRTFGNNVAPYTEWVEASALPALPRWGNDILTGDITKINVNLGSKWLDKLECEKVANYSGLLNDGVTAADGGAFSYGAPWYAYYINGEFTTLADPANRIGRATFDLGSSKPVSEIAMQVAPDIGKASSIKVYASLNNVNWLEIGELTYEGTAIQTINLVLEKEIEARYFKVEMVTTGMFFMVSEIMIYQYTETPYPGYFTEIDNPKFSELDNIARAEGTGVTYNSVDMTGTYTGNVTDGITGPTGYTQTWRGFKQGGNVVFDFGTTVENIGSVDIFTWPANKSGIVKPERIAVEASIDGVNWFTAYETTDFSADKWNSKDDNVLKETIRFDKLLAGRYVRVTVSGGWVFVSEIQVNAHTEVADVVNLSHTYLYDPTSANVITYGMGEKLGDVSGEKRLQWWNLAACEYDPATGTFKVVEIRKGTGGNEEDFRDMVIPAFGFVLGAHKDQSPALAQFINGLNVGDTVYLYGVDLTENTAKALDRACVRKTAIAGETPVSAPVSILKTLSGYAGGDITIWIPFTKDGTTYNTALDIRKALYPDDTKDRDYAWYSVIIVDADGKVTDVLTSRTGKNIVIPEGGFAIGAHSDSAEALTVIENANIGDRVYLYGLDLAENAGKSGALENAYFGVLHRHTMTVHVIPVTCTEDGYTYEDCVCGHRTANHDIVPATGHDVEGQEVLVLDPTCGVGGYSYQICKKCNEKIKVEGSETQPTGKHQYSATVREADNGFFDFKCIVCGESHVGNADGEKAVMLGISHHNTYNWGSEGFGIALITGEAGKKVSEVQKNYNANFAGYVVERIGDHYVATSFVKSGAHELVLPESGFILVVLPTHPKYGQYFGNGELLGNYILPTFVGSYGFGGAFAIDIGAYPEQTNWFYAVAPAEATHVESLGAKVNTVTKSLRFGATFTKSENKVVSLGMLLIPEEKLGKNVLDLEYAQANELVANIRTMRIENYVDGQAFDDYETVTFTVTVNGLEGHEDAIICARPYVVYEDGTVEYGRLVLRSYEAVYGNSRT